MEKGNGEILLFYKYVEIDDPESIENWQRQLCTENQIKGRIRVASEGINGTVGGSLPAIRNYENAMRGNPLFRDIQFKRSAGNADDFESLTIRPCKEIVSLGVDPERITVKGGGKHLSPEEFHAEIMRSKMKNSSLVSSLPKDAEATQVTGGEEEKGGLYQIENEEKIASQLEDGLAEVEMKTGTDEKETVLLDCRNYYEARIGHFDGAIKPVVRKFDEFVDYVDQNMNTLKDKKVLMYCTGGIRCERGSAYLKYKGIEDVYQLSGGIHCYLEQFPDGGFFLGKNLVFDKRGALGSQNPTKVGQCFICTELFDNYKDEFRCPVCRQLIIVCGNCEGPIVTMSDFLKSCATVENEIMPDTSGHENTLAGPLSETKLIRIIPEYLTLPTSLQEVLQTANSWVNDFRGEKVPLNFRCEECSNLSRTPGLIIRRPRSKSRNRLLSSNVKKRKKKKKNKGTLYYKYNNKTAIEDSQGNSKTTSELDVPCTNIQR